MPLDEALPILVDLLRGARDLERLDIVHGDLSEHNVLLKGGRPLLSDFGSATVVGESDRALGHSYADNAMVLSRVLRTPRQPASGPSYFHPMGTPGRPQHAVAAGSELHICALLLRPLLRWAGKRVHAAHIASTRGEPPRPAACCLCISAQPLQWSPPLALQGIRNVPFRTRLHERAAP